MLVARHYADNKCNVFLLIFTEAAWLLVVLLGCCGSLVLRKANFQTKNRGKLDLIFDVHTYMQVFNCQYINILHILLNHLKKLYSYSGFPGATHTKHIDDHL